MLKIVLKSLNKSNLSKDFITRFKDFLGVYGQPNRIKALQVLEFIKKYIQEVDHNDKENLIKLIDMIKRRNYYKRIYTIQSKEDSKMSGQETFLTEYRRKKKDHLFQRNLRKQIITKFNKKYQKYEEAEI